MAEILRPEILLAIAGIMVLLAGAGTPSGSAALILFGLVMIYSAIVSLGYIGALSGMFPAVSVAAVSGIFLLFYYLEMLVRTAVRHWTMGVALIAGLIALFAAFVGYFKPGFAKR
jgi:hypothetical protein